MPTSDPVRFARSRVAYLSRKDLVNHDPAALADARQDLAEAKLERHIREVIESKPPLPAVRRLRLAQLLVDGAR